MTASWPVTAVQPDVSTGLPARLAALATLIEIGEARSSDGGFSERVLGDAEALLTRAGQRLTLSSVHTVVALAGGTGSGKSSLFNRLAGAEFSAVGVTRPVTKDVHACVWGVAGSGPLLEWLGVPRRYRYARASALDRGEDWMTGLVLLDLPDHDSVLTHASDLVDRVVGLADLMIWVLDPQKYADAAVHRRFLIPLAGHSEVLAVVLNQSDLLSGGQIEDCVGDLRRLLDAEELHDVQILVTSATTAEGMEELRKLLIDAVAARRAASARIAADVDGIVARFAPYAGDLSVVPVAAPGTAAPGTAASGADGLIPAGSGEVTQASDGPAADGPPWADIPAAGGPAAGGPAADGPAADGGSWADGPAADGPGAAVAAVAAVAAGWQDGALPAGTTEQLVAAFCRAAGVSAVGDALQSARELRAVDYVGWPVGWLLDRLSGRDPVRRIRLGELWNDLRAVAAGPSGAQQAEIDNALTLLADEIGPPLPAPWSQTARAALRSRAAEIPGALGTVMGESLPPEDKVATWWRFVAAWQGLLLGSVIVGLAWIAAIIVFGVFHVGSNVPRLFGDVSLLAWIAAMIAAMLLLGALTASGCLNIVRAAAESESRQVSGTMRERTAAVAREMVVVPAELELSELGRFRDEFRAAAGHPV
jgi:GTP-binding protein EngB required for normal cell division